VNKAILFCCYSALGVIALHDVSAEEQDELDILAQTIAFFAPNDGRYIDYGESSFSVPRPIVIIDPVVLGSADRYPDNTTVEQIGPDQVRIRITGRVYDFLADMVADHHADIDDVLVSSSYYGTLAPLPIKKVNDSRSHPYFDASSLKINMALRPYAFTGQFDTGELELQVHTGYNGINVTATNFNEGTGTATLSIKARVSREEGKYDIDIDSRNGMDDGLYNPILVHINDAEVTPDNIDTAYALLNGKRVGLRFVDGQLQLDRPIIALSRATPPDAVPNVVNVVGDPDRFNVQYKDHEAVFSWSYTTR